MATCDLLSLDGESTDGRYGLFFLSLPDSGADTCTEMRFVNEVSGRYGANGLIWAPRSDSVSNGRWCMPAEAWTTLQATWLHTVVYIFAIGNDKMISQLLCLS